MLNIGPGSIGSAPSLLAASAILGGTHVEHVHILCIISLLRDNVESESLEQH